MRGILAAFVVIGLMFQVSLAPGASSKTKSTKRARAKTTVKAKAKAKTTTGASKTKNTDSTKPASKTEQSPAKSDSPTPTPATAPDNNHTSLIIDATGLKLDKAMGPKVLRKDGSEVWGTLKDLKDEDYTLLEERGMVGYVATMDEARANTRCGPRPLIVKAIEIRGSRQACDPVISDEDATLVATENARGKFLEKFNVIFIRNAGPPPPPPAPDSAGDSQPTPPNP